MKRFTNVLIITFCCDAFNDPFFVAVCCSKCSYPSHSSFLNVVLSPKCTVVSLTFFVSVQSQQILKHWRDLESQEAPLCLSVKKVLALCLPLPLWQRLLQEGPGALLDKSKTHNATPQKSLQYHRLRVMSLSYGLSQSTIPEYLFILYTCICLKK